ncbi:hypothetical protein GGI11_002669, partial [Coemansia sp. RSA 2049]
MAGSGSIVPPFSSPYLSQGQILGSRDPYTLIPMDLALGLSAFNPQATAGTNGVLPSANQMPSSALTAFSSMSNTLSPQAADSSRPFVLGLQPDFLQQLNPLHQAQLNAAAMATTTRSRATIHSPLNITSTNPLVSSTIDGEQIMSFPTSAFASLNLMNSLDLQTPPLDVNVALQESISNSNMTALLGSSAIPQIPAGIASISSSASPSAANAFSTGNPVLAGMIQPVPNVLPSAATLDPAMLSLQQISALGSQSQTMFPRHNSVPVSQERQASLDAGTIAGANRVNGNILADGAGTRPTASIVTADTSQPMFSSSIVAEPGGLLPTSTSSPPQQQQQQQTASDLNIQIPHNYKLNEMDFVDSLLSSSSLGTTTPNLQDTITSERQRALQRKYLIYGKQMPSSQRTANVVGDDGVSTTAPSLNAGSTTVMNSGSNSSTNSPQHIKTLSSSSPAAGTPSSSTCTSIGQMNKAIIPQMLKDAVAEHPELGCPELIYNLLIIYVVHDCSRIGIYQAHIFWMRVREYLLPKFHLFASIADACRSWSLPDELRAALPPNLDEVCYALSIREAPTDDSCLQIINAIGLLILASYEFKSARFAPMVEHNCLAYKIIVQVKFRGTPFPWRAAKKNPDESGVDSNYEALLRAFWRLSLSLYYATEIFRIDAPEDRDFLPEMPKCDDYFVQRIFVVDPEGEFGFKAVKPSYEVVDKGFGDMFSTVSELYIKQYKIANRFNRVQRGEKTAAWYINYLLEWDRQMLEWREALPHHLRCDLAALARQTQPLDARRRRMNLWGLSEDEMWQRRHQWNV